MSKIPNLNELALLGVDVGFSALRPTTGIAWLLAGRVEVVRTHTDWPRRQTCLPEGAMFDVAAIDGPLLPMTTVELHRRDCEYRFVRGPYARRCKPALSHFGTGLELRRAARDTANQFSYCLRADSSFISSSRMVMPGRSIVEAFPNAFLGVMLDDGVHATRPTLRRGQKFDWLYQQAATHNVFDRLFDRLQWTNDDLLKTLNELDPRRHHEEAAALICLLTAACAATQNSEIVGEPTGGWLWMPPIDLWKRWAIDALVVDQSPSKATRQGNLAQFIARSPLRGSGVNMERFRDGLRDVDL